MTYGEVMTRLAMEVGPRIREFDIKAHKKDYTEKDYQHLKQVVLVLQEMQTEQVI
ncbi:hypothetical protein [Liquorilactobacillus nagelii]|uniref:hypothetical protein n=1 Tax=Liquorilactobacillus nagelii TaxID=82688 RepID=UPI000B21AB81|nr:hypothetical protein [Liquorilactobacillus nagelii]MCI1700378.1 hypothetical protein [Liquorilactobacillus nagelii]QYH54269.1 hypothetical protein G6O73_06050 [Liquorilactobacillus nagelii DSM 13675]ULQ50020.1 hypothetical protein J6864_03050 [Liquorilactobacillus nagelii]